MEVNWQKTIETVSAMAMGAIIAFSSVFIQQCLTERRLVQEWFEINYIEQGIDAVLGYANVLLANMHLPSSEQIKQPLPLDAPSRLETMVGGRVFTSWFSIQKGRDLPGDMTIALDGGVIESRLFGASSNIYESLAKIRQEILSVTISRKRDIYTLNKKNDVIKTEIKKAVILVDEFWRRL